VVGDVFVSAFFFIPFFPFFAPFFFAARILWSGCGCRGGRSLCGGTGGEFCGVSFGGFLFFPLTLSICTSG
jgi:hypothetical protein